MKFISVCTVNNNIKHLLAEKTIILLNLYNTCGNTFIYLVINENWTQRNDMLQNKRRARFSRIRAANRIPL